MRKPQPPIGNQAQRLDTAKFNTLPGTTQARFDLAIQCHPFSSSPQKRRVCQALVDEPGRLTHYYNKVTSRGNISHAVTFSAKAVLRRFGLAMFCYYDRENPPVTKFDEVSRVHAWRVDLLENYNAKKYGEL